jgi:hypothetical protein
MKILDSIFGFFKRIFVRPGLRDFLKKNLNLARSIVIDLAQVHNGESLHNWKQLAFDKLKQSTGEVRDNWIEILLCIVWEEIKARK